MKLLFVVSLLLLNNLLVESNSLQNEAKDSAISGKIEKSVSHCSNGYYMCQGNSRCIPLSWICDGQNDCQNQEDESPQICQRNRNYTRIIDQPKGS